MSKLDTLRRGLDLFPGEKDPAPGRSLDAMRADARRRLGRESASVAVICASIVALSVLAVTESLPALRGSTLSSSFLSGALMGLFCVAGVVSVRQVAALRRAQKLSQAELADAVGTTRQTITSIEVGRYTASLPLAHKIARYFGLTIEEVFDFSEIDEEL